MAAFLRHNAPGLPHGATIVFDPGGVQPADGGRRVMLAARALAAEKPITWQPLLAGKAFIGPRRGLPPPLDGRGDEQVLRVCREVCQQVLHSLPLLTQQLRSLRGPLIVLTDLTQHRLPKQKVDMHTHTHQHMDTA